MFQEPQEVSVTGVQWAWRRTREAEGVEASHGRACALWYGIWM